MTTLLTETYFQNQKFDCVPLCSANPCMSQIKYKLLSTLFQILSSWSLFISSVFPLSTISTLNPSNATLCFRHVKLVLASLLSHAFVNIAILGPVYGSSSYHLSNSLMSFRPIYWLKKITKKLSHCLCWPTLYLPFQQHPVAVLALSPIVPCSCLYHSIYQGSILLPVYLSV